MKTKSQNMTFIYISTGVIKKIRTIVFGSWRYYIVKKLLTKKIIVYIFVCLRFHVLSEPGHSVAFGTLFCIPLCEGLLFSFEM